MVMPSPIVRFKCGNVSCYIAPSLVYIVRVENQVCVPVDTLGLEASDNVHEVIT